jgi:hypothetical protein
MKYPGKMVAERRKYTRFSVSNNAFAALEPGFDKVGKIQDISILGLAFEYITDEVADIEVSRVDIFLRGEDFFISKIPCKVVYDISLEDPEVHQISPHKLMHKRCGLQFESLSNTGRVMIEQFMEAYTTGLVSGRKA